MWRLMCGRYEPPQGFAALREDDTVVTWGYWNYGGKPDGQAAMALASGQVQDVFLTIRCRCSERWHRGQLGGRVRR